MYKELIEFYNENIIFKINEYFCKKYNIIQIIDNKRTIFNYFLFKYLKNNNINLINEDYFAKKGTLNEYQNYLKFYAEKTIETNPKLKDSFWIQQVANKLDINLDINKLEELKIN